MTLLTAAVVTLVVWSISLIRSVRLRALIYSFPLPITLVLLTTGLAVDAQQLVGVVLLNVFIAAVAWAHHGRRWPILLADLAGVIVYVTGSWALLRAGDLPFIPVLASTFALWTLAVILTRRARISPARATGHPPADNRPGRNGLRMPAKLLVLAAGALLMVWLSQQLHGMVVTFPYSGVLVVVEARKELVEFRAHFARNSLALLAFFTAYYLAQDVSRPVATVAGWAAFCCCAALLHLGGRRVRHRVRPPSPYVRGPATQDDHDGGYG
ncbi:MAG TPA: hypothetical protein VFB84_09115 [Micromonosporaceae bacterium]|nr:hypothetical protein [Micromonosporaceae bacterium]